MKTLINICKVLILLIPFMCNSQVRTFDEVVHDMDDRKALICTNVGNDYITTYSVSMVNSDTVNVIVLDIDSKLFGFDLKFIEKFNVYIARSESIINYEFNKRLNIQIGWLSEYGYKVNIKTKNNYVVLDIENDSTKGEITISNFDDFKQCFRFVEYAMKNI